MVAAKVCRWVYCLSGSSVDIEQGDYYCANKAVHTRLK